MTKQTVAPHELVAAEFMNTRGYTSVPHQMKRLDDQDFAWQFTYLLDEGRLELDVSWTETDGWRAQVFDFERAS